MKYTFTDNKVESAPKKALRISFVENGQTRFVEKADGSARYELSTGPAKNFTRRACIRLWRKALRDAKSNKYEALAISLERGNYPQLKDISDEEYASLVAENFEMANFAFTTFKSKPKGGWPMVKEIIICESGKLKKAKAGIERGRTVGKYVNICRELANTPGGEMTPTSLARDARKLGREAGFTVSVFGKKEMEQKKMGGVLGVAQGSSEEPKFIVAKYWGAGRPSNKKNTRNAGKNNPIVLVGKGVTFDTGGINLKPGDSALGMHMDMSGGAAVLATIALAAKLGLKRNVIALVAAVENMTSGSSYRPGDVLRSMSGKTIEVLNTDAEGRVSLADSLHFAKQYKPSLVVDVATLTGGSLAALGQQASAVFSNQDELLLRLTQWGEKSGDYVWPLPLWSEYEELMKGRRGDWANIAASGNSRYGDVVNAAAFLHQFIKPHPWVHIDIAPRMETISSDNLAHGASGEPVRLLYKLLEEF